jgi:fructokinase
VIVIGGGIMRRKLLLGLLHTEFIRMLSGYVDHPLLGQQIEQYIVAPSLGGDVGVKGGMILSQL